MSRIQAVNLTFGYEGSYDNIFEDVNFQIDTDWKLGMIGRNGMGKTTLLRLLQGKYPFQGTLAKSVQVQYFPFPVEDPAQFALDAVEGFLGPCQLWQLQRELSLLEVDEEILYRPFQTLSFGEQTKVMLAALFLQEHSYLLIDEPTNHLDIQARKAVGQYLNGKKGFLLVSHDRSLLDLCIDHVLALNRETIEIQKGNFSSWYENKQRQDAFELAENEKLKGEIQRLGQAARRTSGWSDQVEKTKYGTKNSGLRPDRGYIGHKAAKMMKRSKQIENRRAEAVQEKQALLKDLETAEKLKVLPLKHHRESLLRGEGIWLSYDGRQILSDISFELKQGERLFLGGGNGSGKSSLLKLILQQCGYKSAETAMGGSMSWTGEVAAAAGLVISYVSQDTSWLAGSLEAFAQKEGLEESLFKAILRKLDFSRTQFDKKMEAFSEGQKKKVLIAASLCRPAHLYLWDEPLNFVDIFSRMQIEELLLSFQPTMIFVEHDQTFSDKIKTKELFLANNA